jgi:hypothetical protein
VFSIGCVFAELLHCLSAAAATPRSSRVLFGHEPSAHISFDFPFFKHEYFAKFFPVLGKPSQQDVEEYARAAGVAAVSKVVEKRGTSSDAESARRSAVGEIVEVLTTGYETWQGGRSPVDTLAAKYSGANTECPAAVALLLRMLTYSPSNRISCSQALCHQFLNPDGADVAAGDDGHERVDRSAVQLQQLDMDELCYRDAPMTRLDPARINARLMREAQVLKFCNSMPPVLAAASALVVFGRCRVPALVVQRPALLGTMLSQGWRAHASLQYKVCLGKERPQLLCCGCPLSALLLRLATVVDHSGRTSIEHMHVVCIMKRYLNGVARRLWSKCSAALG